MLVESEGTESEIEVEWEHPCDRTKRAHANEIDATEAGACGVSLAVIEQLNGYVTIGRAHIMSGADYYIVPQGKSPDYFENALRLEISGLNKGGISDYRYRLERKINQTKVSGQNKPAIASVVGFEQKVILISEIIL